MNPRVLLSDCISSATRDKKLIRMAQMERSLTEVEKSICKSHSVKGFTLELNLTEMLLNNRQHAGNL